MAESNENTPSLDALQDKIDAAKLHARPRAHDAAANDKGRAMQVAGEFAVGAGVGSLCGYAVDRWLGTSPFGFIIGFFLGFAAGVYNMIRAAKKDDATS